MDTIHTPKNCRWAQPALYLPLPQWIDAWNAPWTCVREPPPRLLESAGECATCPRWEPRAGEYSAAMPMGTLGL